MSHDIEYKDENGKLFKLDVPIQEGGTQEVGGNKETWLNVTYNYSDYYRQYLDKNKGITWLYGKKGKDCIKKLEKAIEPYKDAPRCSDYWKPVPGNCIVPLKIFLEWCKKYPEGKFDGD